MRPLARSALFIASLIAFSSQGLFAQTKQGTGVITGRVTLGEKGIGNIPVAAYPSERTGPERNAIASAKTDFEGRYRLSNLPVGRYNIVAVAPALVEPNEGQFGEAGKSVTLTEGETVEKVDFALVRGGVITGRVTDSDGMPVIGERVQVTPAGGQPRRNLFRFDPFMYTTDDRGIYRIYGLPAGRYKVSVGESTDGGMVTVGLGGRGYYTRTFHPNVTEESRATTIEIGEGSEVSNVDISLGRKSQRFTATGRVVDESGQPVPNVQVGHAAIMRENRMGGFGLYGISDENGRFRLEGLVPGRYAAFVWNDTGKEGYSDPVTFEVAEGDVSGLEVKLRRGASISGVAVVEGTTDRSILAKLSELTVGAASMQRPETLMIPNFSNTKIGADGSFRLTGIRPGKFRIYVSLFPQQVTGFTLVRVERDGLPQREIEVEPGAQITNVRLVLEYGTGSVSGLVKIEGGALPEGARMSVMARRTGEAGDFMPRASQADSRGRFRIEGLPPGDFEITLNVIIPGERMRGFPPVRQRVTVANGVESEVTLTLNLNARPGEGNQP